MEGGSAPYSSAMAPSGSYILIIVSQPVNENDKVVILDRLNKGLLSWDIESTGCDLTGLETVCSSISSKHLDDTDVLIQHSTESLGVEVLVNPTVSTLKQCVKNFLSTSTGHKQLIHTGYTFAGSGSWILQNGTFSFDDFLEIFQQADVQSQKRCQVNIHCSEVGQWNSGSFAKDIFSKVANVSFNPTEKVQSVPGSEHLLNCLKEVLNSQDLEEMMEASSLVGNIRFNRPTLYMFPAGQGDCALFGINGFNMLIDGGFNRKPCSWEFIRHLDRLDAVLVTRLCENNVCGMSTLMKRKSLNNTYPQIGYVFCNIPEDKTPSPKEETAKDDLIVSVVNEGHNFIQTLNELKLKPHQCWRDLAAEPFVLYHKVGHGTLEMHILSPPKDSKEMKEFIAEWSSFKETFSSSKSGLKHKGLDHAIPLSHATSVCAVLIWRPADPKDTITRILFPGSAPQNKIFESLEKLKTLDVLNHPVVTKASLTAITKTMSTKVEKSVSRTPVPNRKITASPALSVASAASKNGDIGGLKIDNKEVKKSPREVKKEVKKEIKKESIMKEKKDVKSEVIKKEVKKDVLPKEAKKEVKKVIKKDNKDVKTAVEKKTAEVKSAVKKEIKEVKSAVKKDTTAAAKTVGEVKKASTTTVKKSATPVKKDVKSTTATKIADSRKSTPGKTSEIKATRESNVKKTTDNKTALKAKPKSATTAPKTAAPKTKPVAVPKPGSKMTKAVAASSIVASAVAVTAAALDLNDKKEEITKEVELEAEKLIEPEVTEQAVNLDTIEKPEEEVVVSPLPPEALSPTPSESVSLTPSDTLSSAPLETVSPTPPLANDPISTEEKEVNEVKEIDQDMPYESEIAEEVAEVHVGNGDLEKEVNEEDYIEQDAPEIDNEETEKKVEVANDFEKETDDVGCEDMEKEVEEISNAASEKEIDISSVHLENEVEDIVDENLEKDIDEGADNNVNKEVEEGGSENLEKDVDEASSCDMNQEIEEIDDEILDRETNKSQEDNLEKETYDKELSSDIYEKVDIEAQLARLQENSDAMSTSFVGSQEVEEIKEIDSVQSKPFDAQESQFEKAEAFISSERPIESEGYIIESTETNVDDQLAQMSMEGSFCATGNYEIEEANVENFENIGMDHEREDITRKLLQDNEIEENAKGAECISNVGNTEEIENDEMKGFEVKDHRDIDEIEVTKTETIQFENQNIENIIDQKTESYFQREEHDVETKELTQIEEKEIHSDSVREQENEIKEQVSYEQSCDEQYDQTELDALKETINRATKEDYELSQNIINDADMQESSVDEPEEIVRKESDVSIILNDDEQGDAYLNQFRRKSGTESEDDVDLQQYMSKEEKFDHDKLKARQEQNSDDEDVVKSPTPHAVVDYEDGMNNLLSGKNNESGFGEKDVVVVEHEKETYMSEKQYFDEKDHDSTEDQDVDDGEMIRHPTPPEMKYSEDEMRDPIGPHFITTPGLKQGTDITEQPLYEEAEDEVSDRSESPVVVEQPVFGSAVEADFPELVTVSGGTTPSEPQSPKAGFDSKKFGAEAVVMEALSEHDISESSTHSPLCLDNEKFDLPLSSDKVQSQIENEQEEIHNEVIENECSSKYTDREDPTSVDNVASSDYAQTKGDALSDDESYSQNEKSETHSEKSDDDDEKSHTRHDDKSDMHDDKSDNQFDGKSDVMDDERRSDIHDDERKSDMHEDDRNDSHHDDQHEGYDDKRCDELSDASEVENFKHENYEIESQKFTSYQQSEFHAEYNSEAIEEKINLPEYGMPDDVNKEHILSFDEENVNQSTTVPYDTMEIASNEHAPFNYDGVQDSYNEKEASQKIDSEDFHVPKGFHDEKESYLTESYLDNVASERDSNAVIGTSVSLTDNQCTDFTQKEMESTILSDEYENIETSDSYTNETEPSVVASTIKDDFDGNSHYYSEENAFSKDKTISFDQEHNFNTYGETKKSQYSSDQHFNSSMLSEQTNFEMQNQPTDVHLEENIDFTSKYEKTVLTEHSEHYELPSHIPNMSQFDASNYSYKAESSNTFSTNHNYENSAYASEIYDENDQKASTLQDLADVNIKTKFEELNADKFSNPPPTLDAHGTDSAEINVAEKLYSEEVQSRALKTEYYPEDVSTKLYESDEKVSDMPALRNESTFSEVNGGKHESWSHATSYSEQFDSQTASHLEGAGYSTMQQETSYIINSRFHSDSPEDNVMRSDSSPDVPYPPSAIDSLQHKIGVKPENFMERQEEYNLNLPQTGGIPTSPNKSKVPNQDDPYGESSEDDDSSSVPGNVSPYAYTNKAYAKEEEDIDGNHIYKESAFETNTEIKDKEFDGNNPQSINTQQVGFSENQSSQQVNYSQSYQESEYTGNTNYDFRLEEWEKPMGLPTPPETGTKTVTKKVDKSASKSLGKSVIDSNGKAYSPSVATKMSSPLKKPKPKATKDSSGSPVYVDLAYVPHHGDPHYCDVEFFKKIRARYYVFSGINPSKEVLNALLEAKKTWKEEMEVTIIPTYETDTLGYWMAQNQDDLVTYSIEVAPSASRCTVNLQDHETSCAAYRLEF